MRIVSKHEYEELLAKSDILEQDRHGVKVVRMPDGNFLKTFWYRRKFSSRRIYSERLRFSLHAASLTRRGIPTVTVVEALRIPHLHRTGVIYRPLEGRTLREVAGAGEFDGALAGKLGAFIARLHREGIKFRALHLGNVLLCPDGELGLIDISDMNVFLWPLNTHTRLRNFTHLLRYRQDLNVLKGAGLPLFVEGYLQSESPRGLEERVTALLRRYD